MCNLYGLTKGQAAIRDLFRAKHNRVGSLRLFPRRMSVQVGLTRSPNLYLRIPVVHCVPRHCVVFARLRSEPGARGKVKCCASYWTLG